LAAKDIDLYTTHWTAAGLEMRESMVLIAHLNDKLTTELTRRKADLAASQATAVFMRDEEKSLMYAMANVKREIEQLHQVVARSGMRYFVDTKPIHGHVVQDVPGALASYMEQKEQEKARLLAQKAAQMAAVLAPPKPQKQQQTAAEKKRRRTMFGGSGHLGKQKTSSGKSTITKKSLQPGKLEPIGEEDRD
jgi:hypothetical protein